MFMNISSIYLQSKNIQSHVYEILPCINFLHLQTQKGSLKVKGENQIAIPAEINLLFHDFCMIYFVSSKEKILLKNVISVCIWIFFMFFLVVLFRARLFLRSLPCGS